MRTSTAAWAAALAVLSSHGPFTTAEAAPARQPGPNQHRQRSFSNVTLSAMESTSTTALDTTTPLTPLMASPSTLVPVDTAFTPPVTDLFPAPSPTHTRRVKSSAETTLTYDSMSVIERFIAEGVLPETTNAVVTTTVADAQPTGTDTYTITYTETSSPVRAAVASSRRPSLLPPPFPVPTSISRATEIGDFGLSTGALPFASPNFRPTFTQPTIPSSDLTPPRLSSTSSSESGSTQTSGSAEVLSTSSVLGHLHTTPHVRPIHQSHHSHGDNSTRSDHQPTNHAKSGSAVSTLHSTSAVNTVSAHQSHKGQSKHIGSTSHKPYDSHGVFPPSNVLLTGHSRTQPGHFTHMQSDTRTSVAEPTGSFFNVTSLFGPQPTNPFTLMRPTSGPGTFASGNVENPFTLFRPTSTAETSLNREGASSSSSSIHHSANRTKHASERTTATTASGFDRSSSASSAMPSSLQVAPFPSLFSNFPVGTGRPGSGHKRPANTASTAFSSGISSELAPRLSRVTGTDGVMATVTAGVGTGVLNATSNLGTFVATITGTDGAVITVTSDLGTDASTPTSADGTLANPASDSSSVRKATKATGIDSILSSVQSEVTHAVTEIAQATSGSDIPAAATNPLSVLQSSLDSKLSDIVATVTDTALLSTLTSAFSSILTSAASSLGSTLNSPAAAATSALPAVTKTTATSIDTGSIVAPLTSPTVAITVSAADTGVTVSVPASPVTTDPNGGTTSISPAATSPTDTTAAVNTNHVPTTTTDTTPTGTTDVAITPAGTTPTGTDAVVTTSAQTTAADTTPADTAATDTASAQTTAADTTSGDNTTTQTTTAAITPGDSTTRQTAAASTTPVSTATAGTVTSKSGATSDSSDLTSATPVGTLSASSSVAGTNTNATTTQAGFTQSTSIALSTGTTETPKPSATASTDATLAIPSSSSTASTAIVTSTQTTPTTAHSIVPTATNTDTSLTLPTAWTFAPSSSASKDTSRGIAIATSTNPSTTTGIPTYIPQLVQPPNGMPEKPADSTLIQVGFEFGLNYPFVVSAQESASQIFAFLPQGIAYGLGISTDNVTMNALLPYDTTQTLGFITTLAQAYVPSALVTQLQLGLHTSSSLMYSNSDAPINTLMTMINPTIPIIPGSTLDGAPVAGAYSPGSTLPSFTGDGAPLGGQAQGSTSSKVKGTSVGIGVGAVAGAAVYAAAMVYIARRYRQKRKGHQRSSSVPPMGEKGSPASGGMGAFLMSGGQQGGRASYRDSADDGGGLRGSTASAGSSNGRSVREQGISAPIMSENSLGWT